MKPKIECTHATLKLGQTQVKLDDAQKALEAMAKDRERAVQGAFDTAAKEYQMRTVNRNISATLLSRSPGKTTMERFKERKTPLHPTGLTRSRVVNRAAWVRTRKGAPAGASRLPTVAGFIAQRVQGAGSKRCRS